MIGSARRPVPRSWAAIPPVFIAAVFMRRTLSNAQRTISSTRSSVASPGATAGPSSACSSSSATERIGSASGAYVGGPAPTRPIADSVLPAIVRLARTRPSQPSSR
jgi:hypothetical protein